MNKDDLIVFMRIALYALSGYGMNGGWMPQRLADQLIDPAVIELAASAVLGAAVFFWYLISKARKALRQTP